MIFHSENLLYIKKHNIMLLFYMHILLGSYKCRNVKVRLIV